jgi:hypothetical protein
MTRLVVSGRVPPGRYILTAIYDLSLTNVTEEQYMIEETIPHLLTL